MVQPNDENDLIYTIVVFVQHKQGRRCTTHHTNSPRTRHSPPLVSLPSTFLCPRPQLSSMRGEAERRVPSQTKAFHPELKRRLGVQRSKGGWE